MPDVFFFRHHLAHHAGEQTYQRGHRTRKPFVIAEGGQADQRAAEQADDAAADQAHQKRTFQGQIEKPVAADQAQHHADGQRRHQEQQQHYFLVGVAVFGEQKLAERAETHQQRGQGGRPADLQNHRKK